MPRGARGERRGAADARDPGDAEKDVRDAHFNLRNAVAHVSTRGRDPWAEYSEVRQRILRKHFARLAELA